jgi:hypothetical protein
MRALAVASLALGLLRTVASELSGMVGQTYLSSGGEANTGRISESKDLAADILKSIVAAEGPATCGRCEVQLSVAGGRSI